MYQKAVRFLSRNNISPNDIIYIKHVDRKINIYLKNGSIIPSYLSLKVILDALPKGAFLNITKGILISAAEVKKIEGNIYTMSDGTVFTGRVRGAGEHKANRKNLEKHIVAPSRISAETINKRFSVLDNSPLPTCVIEAVFNTAGHGVDFIFRYANAAMANLESVRVEDMIDRSAYDIFKRINHHWIETYTAVAVDGASRIFEDTHIRNGKTVTAVCSQPLPDFCMVTLIDGKITK